VAATVTKVPGAAEVAAEAEAEVTEVAEAAVEAKAEVRAAATACGSIVYST